MRTLFVGLFVSLGGVAEAPRVGSGRRLLDNLDRVPLRLVGAKPLPTGVPSLAASVGRPA